MISNLQTKFGFSAAAGTTISQQFASQVTLHSCLWGWALWQSSSATCTVADSLNGNWTAIGSPQTGAGNLAGYRAQMFYFPDSNSGTVNVTATISGSVNRRELAIHEYGGADRTSPIDQSTVSNVNSNGLSSTPTITTTVANSAIVVGVADWAGATGVSGGFTERALHGTFDGNVTEDKIVSATGTYAPGVTDSSATDHIVHIANIKAYGASYLHPTSDITVGDYQPTPTSPSTLYDKLDELVADDTDYISGTTTVEIKLT